ncbi:YkgJ family cysteine cluster protein [Gracilibacillus dipsosauri]|uniref:YkgJ family cysteine cluster protein n=1 Tax=Gracilibacillus dipsosauri TaxID=178340 RepID=A0A317L0T7_9BACI|nr:YkgJ family cysteine cluster protein [Gracilibacillus dipsosauri]PWU69213.1 YkgJ family cysteine cluster protein [Gracilibacillus dipsosauri]
MEQYLSFETIQKKCEQLTNEYEIDGDRFYHVVEKWADKEATIDEKLMASFTELLVVVSDEITRMEDHVELSSTCRMGCAFCCYFPIIINEMEAKLMLAAINQFSNERQIVIQRHLSAYYKKYSKKIEEVSQISFEEDEDFKMKYRQSLLPCPLLNTETNQCLAYEIRPIPCRTYMNYTDPAVCEKNLMPKETISFEFLYAEYMGALNEFLQFLYEDGDTGIIYYPDDLYKHDYLINWMKV